MRALTNLITPSNGMRRTDVESSKFNKDLVYTNKVLLPFLGIVTIFVFAHLGFTVATTTALLWAMASLASGTALGFLFGIPKILQDNSIHDKPEKVASESNPNKRSDAFSYRQQVNTNLTEISDWLTKIIVGLTLVHLAEIQQQFNNMANTFASGLNAGEPALEKSFAFALLTVYTILGFFFGYLYTRLFLAIAFSKADQEASKIQIERLIETEVNRVSNADLQGGLQQPTLSELKTAEKVADIASQGDLTSIKQKLVDLAKEYERIRTVMLPGDTRTRQMEIVITKMRTLSIAGYSLISEFAQSQSPGERLVAIAMLQVKPNSDYLDWLADRVVSEKPFAGYHSSVALQYAVRSFDDSKNEHLKQAVEKALAKMKPETDRAKVLRDAIQELNRQ